jgi:CPA2 family monovalent cation:H+ antiporter-2
MGAGAALWWGWSVASAVIFGLALSVASTVVLLKALESKGILESVNGRIAIGWLVVEDLAMVVVLVLLPPLAGVATQEGARIGADVWLALGRTLVEVVAFVTLMLVFGRRALPWLLWQVTRTGSRELFTLCVVTAAVTIAWGSAQLFGVSFALGAFFAGMVLRESQFSHRAASETLPLRDAFAVLFFVSVGMLFEPSFILREPLLVGVALGLVVIVKPLASTLLLLGLGKPARSALGLGLSRGQVGEFSFILAALGTELEVLPAKAGSALVAASMLSITLNPLLLSLAPRASGFVPERTPDEAKGAKREPNPERHHVIVVGYGPVGRTVSRLLAESGVEPSIIELNIETVRALRAQGMHAVYGDAGRSETLEEAGTRSAVGVVLTAPVEGGADAVVRRARELNPKVFVVARSTYLSEVSALRGAGADVVFSGEGEIALAMTEFTLSRLGATPEQMDRERERVHRELGTRGEPV